jgi:transcriptional regulator with XRE-family HTH domain
MTRPNAELSEFLRSRRARLDPSSIGLMDASSRKVPGLRREELARLAGMSVDYYTRLEQGRPITPSDQVLDALASALQLDEVERRYLFAVARQRGPIRRSSNPVQSVPTGILDLIDRLGEAVPVYVLGRRTEVLFQNRIARSLFAMPAEEQNATRWMLLDDDARTLFGSSWEKVASDLVGTLRMDAARHPEDPRLSALVDELSSHSDYFRRWWSRQTVTERTHDVKVIRHPLAGELTFHTEALVLPSDPDQTLFVYLAERGSPSEQALIMLANHDSAS